MTNIVIGIAIGAAAACVVAALWRLRQPRRRLNPNSAEALGLLPTSPQPSPDQTAELRQRLRLKVMYDEAKIDRLVAAERERTPSASETDCYRAAIERWERDNR